MSRLHPRATRTDTLFPYTTLFRSDVAGVTAGLAEAFAQVFDLVLRERQAEACVGFLQPGERDALDPAARGDAEQRAGFVVRGQQRLRHRVVQQLRQRRLHAGVVRPAGDIDAQTALDALRSEEHTSELQSLMRISYAVFCLKKKNNTEAI